MEQLPKMSAADLKDVVKDGKTMLFFSATWCPDCAFIKPAMPEIEAEYADYKFIAVDRDENIDLAIELNVFGIPSFIAYADGTEIGRLVNKDRKTKAEVEEFINSLTTNAN
ncbi:thioredoxin family protein [Levilactobacillus cerevisiae]|uniref:thioredoxin family protein n=1 Tax=Levilactobacillus cerevisiae TaxID=1704076 RepID=UPI000F7B2928|nr:thioredoxin family protein [Levilactobacillus cerevisiae]